MSEIKPTLKRLGLVYLVLFPLVSFFCAVTPDRFPIRSFASVLLAALFSGFFLSCSFRAAQRGTVKRLVQGMLGLLVLLFFLRGVKYSAFSEVGILSRYTWYCYYIPLLLIPLCFFLASVSIYAWNPAGALRRYLWMAAVTAVLLLLVLTNDLHQLVFRFDNGLENWRVRGPGGWTDVYSYGAAFYLLTGWEYLLYLISLVVLIRKSRLSMTRKYAPLLLIPMGIGIPMLVLVMLDKAPKLNGVNFFQLPEAMGFMIIGILECCMGLGMIPTNESYQELIERSSLAMQITDRDGTPVYRSGAAAELRPEMIRGDSDTLIDENTLLRRMRLPGGYGFRQEDITALNRINGALEETREKLTEEAELVRMQNELYGQQAKIEQRIRLYDAIARETVAQSRAIAALAEEGLRLTDEAAADSIRRRIVLFGVAIKRHANLMILADRSPTIRIGELALSAAEYLHYLEGCGVPSGMSSTAEGSISSAAALRMFTVLEAWIERNLTNLKGVYVTLSAAGAELYFKIVLEGAQIVPPEQPEPDLPLRTQRENEVTYLCYTLPKEERV